MIYILWFLDVFWAFLIFLNLKFDNLFFILKFYNIGIQGTDFNCNGISGKDESSG